MQCLIGPRGAGLASVLAFAASNSPIHPQHKVAHCKGNQLGTSGGGGTSLYDMAPSAFAASEAASRTSLATGIDTSIGVSGNLNVNSGVSASWNKIILGDNERVPFGFGVRDLYFSGLTYSEAGPTLDGLDATTYNDAIAGDAGGAGQLVHFANTMQSKCAAGCRYGHYGLPIHRQWINEASIPATYAAVQALGLADASNDLGVGGEAFDTAIPDYVYQQTLVWTPRTYAQYNVGNPTSRTNLQGGSACTYAWTMKYARWCTWIAKLVNETYAVNRPIVCLLWTSTVVNDYDVSAETYAACIEGFRLGGANACVLLCVEDNATIDPTTAARIANYQAGIRMAC